MAYSPGKAENPLLVFDRLEVGPVRVEPRRIRVPYRLVYQGASDQVDLIYKYEERVFDRKNPADINLAAMIGAQVALNYGLFCRSLVFYGPFDKLDRRFIQDMAENTAREIYVKKFLEPNPFLTGGAARLRPEKKERYLTANIEFPDALPPVEKTGAPVWQTDNLRAAVLSSGGKDSLLSFGLCQELGFETHALYVNESGRHWLTALNAYRYFKENIPGTARVWTNSDRVFTWMLRHIPFIRPDFSRLRSDEYPIRLWTVAVFLFGVLPLLYKRKIGFLLIGDEFDTTRQKTHHGIPHYDGLYDQSYFFDRALSRYFQRKGWNIGQFSVVRPLSELMIQKVLVERYPHLQAQQISCHAAHKDGDRVLPCGQCEKCRRIVTMLTALGADIGRCGYRADQVDRCLAQVVDKGINQPSADIGQLLFLLQQKGLIKNPPHRQQPYEPQPQVMKLRFDPDRSPIQAIPPEWRLPLFRLYLTLTAGAVQRTGREWRDIDLLSAIVKAPDPG